MPIQSATVSFGSGSAGGGPETVLPFRLLVVADFLGRRLAVGEEPTIAPMRVDKERLNEVFARLAPAVALEVPNHLGGVDKTVELKLSFGRYEDFQPDAFVAALPAAARLLALRGKLNEAAAAGRSPREIEETLRPELTGIADGEQLLSVLQGQAGPQISNNEPKEPGAGGGGSLLDDIASETEVKKSAPGAGGAGAISSVIGSLSGSSRKKSPTAGVQAAVAWIDERLGRQVDALLHAPEVARLEEAWRGLRMLVGRTDFRKDIVVEILPAAKEDLRKILIEGAMDAEYNQPGDPPLAVVVVDHAFDRSARDMTSLQELAQAGERLQTPVIVEASAAFLGLESIGPLGGKGSLNELVSDPQFAKWMGVRQSDASRWLAVCLNRFLLRRPWGEEGQNVRAFDYHESCREQQGEGLTWGSPVWGMACCLTRSFARQGWPHFISGMREDGLVEDLALRSWEARKGATAPITLETGFSDQHAQDLATAGLIAFQCGAKSDRAYFTYVPSAHLPKRYGDAGATQDAAMKTLLPYQLYAGRVAAWLNRTVWAGASGSGPEELAARLRSQTLDLLATAKGPAPQECALVQVTDSPDHAGRYRVTFEIRPPFKLFNMTPRLELTVEMAK